MTIDFCKTRAVVVWLDQRWRMTFENGIIHGIETGEKAQPGDAAVDTLLPALGNLHSHSFQRAMAGMT